jgi:hypothetical protein
MVGLNSHFNRIGIQATSGIMRLSWAIAAAANSVQVCSDHELSGCVEHADFARQT